MNTPTDTQFFAPLDAEERAHEFDAEAEEDRISDELDEERYFGDLA
jgi:hypothetical protein